MSTVADLGKKTSAYAAVDLLLKNNMLIGVGSGSTIVFAAARIGELIKERKWNINCVPTSYQARQLIIDNNLILSDLDRCPELDLAIDGADEVDSNMTCIKGGGGCLTQEKIVASCAKKFVIIGDERKDVKKLGESWSRGIPIEVLPLAHVPVARKINAMFGGEVELRMAKSKMGPVVTDNGNFLLDWKFDTTRDWNWKDVHVQIKLIPGIVETGLFVDMVSEAYIGTEQGTYYVKKLPPVAL